MSSILGQEESYISVSQAATSGLLVALAQTPFPTASVVWQRLVACSPLRRLAKLRLFPATSNSPSDKLRAKPDARPLPSQPFVSTIPLVASVVSTGNQVHSGSRATRTCSNVADRRQRPLAIPSGV